MQRGLERAQRKGICVCAPEATHPSHPWLAAGSVQAFPWTSLIPAKMQLKDVNSEQLPGKMVTELEFPEGHSLQPLPHSVTWSVRQPSFLVSS